MRRSASRIFVKGFLKSLLFFLFFAAIMVFTYRLVMNSYATPDTNVIEVVSPIQDQAPITEARIDDVSKQLIFSVDEETGEIQKLVLEIFNCEEHRLYYITIPIKTQLTLSDSLHRELVLIKPSIPQFLKLSAITGYLPKETVYEYGVLMIEDLLNIQISYYTVVPQSLFESVFNTEAVKKNSINKQESSEDIFPRQVFSDEFLEYLRTIDTEAQLGIYIEELYGQINSNLSLDDKLNYVESYLRTPGKNISFDLIAGENRNSAYYIDTATASTKLESYIKKQR